MSVDIDLKLIARIEDLLFLSDVPEYASALNHLLEHMKDGPIKEYYSIALELRQLTPEIDAVNQLNSIALEIDRHLEQVNIISEKLQNASGSEKKILERNLQEKMQLIAECTQARREFEEKGPQVQAKLDNINQRFSKWAEKLPYQLDQAGYSQTNAYLMAHHLTSRFVDDNHQLLPLEKWSQGEPLDKGVQSLEGLSKAGFGPATHAIASLKNTFGARLTIEDMNEEHMKLFNTGLTQEYEPSRVKIALAYLGYLVDPSSDHTQDLKIFGKSEDYLLEALKAGLRSSNVEVIEQLRAGAENLLKSTEVLSMEFDPKDPNGARSIAQQANIATAIIKLCQIIPKQEPAYAAIMALLDKKDLTKDERRQKIQDAEKILGDYLDKCSPTPEKMDQFLRDHSALKETPAQDKVMLPGFTGYKRARAASTSVGLDAKAAKPDDDKENDSSSRLGA